MSPPETSLAEELGKWGAVFGQRKTRYVELTARTNFSFLSGATPPERLMERAKEIGYDTIAVTDRDGLYGIVRAHEAARILGVRLVVGCELTLDPEPGDAARPDPSSDAPRSTTLTVLVENHAGYINLCKILTESHARHPKSDRTSDRARGAGDRPDDDDALPRHTFAGVPLSFVCAHAEGLWALADATLPIDVLHRSFGRRLSIAIHLHRDGEERARIGRTLEAQRRYGVPVCAVGRVMFAEKGEKPVFDVLQCIREGTTLDAAGRDLLPNAEAHLKSEEEIDKLFSLHPEWVERSRFVADRCLFSIDELSYRFPYELTDLVHRDFRGHLGETADEALARLTWAGARERYADEGGIPDKVSVQLEKELALIRELEVAAYFLSVRAIIDIARRRDILCQGRGSAANSAVCYCLGITAVDPARSEMLFERFLSTERRGEPPDIDVDFEHERREEVIQEIYATYGRDRAAMVSEIISYRSKSALRDVGKVFGFSLEQVDRLSDVVTWWDGVSAVGASRLRAFGFSPDDTRVRWTLQMARVIQGFPRHLSTHVGGFVLSAASLSEVAPVEPATMPDRTIVPWDKDDIEALGFFKVDVLGLGMLTALRKGLDLVRDSATRFALDVPRGLLAGTATARLAAIPAEDPVIYAALSEADTVGVFQIESRAQMAMLPRLRPKKFYDLVIEVALVRPGPIQGGMVHPYLRRRSGEEKNVEPPHELLAPILERTLGVPLFQEQVMQIAIAGAGYTGGEADQLRRDMASWRKNGQLERHRERLLEGFRKNGIDEAFGERLFKQIQGFGEYGFPESHASSFALLVYASAWLKVYFPAEFAASLVNSQPMGFYSPSTIVQDAQRHGVVALPIDVNASDWDCTCTRLPRDAAREAGNARAPLAPGAAALDTAALAPGAPLVPGLRLGLRLVRELGEETGRRIERARKEAPFSSLEDLAGRAKLGRKDLLALAEAGALDDLAKGRREAIWSVVLPRDEDMWADVAPSEPRASFRAMSRGEQLVLDYERTGISVADHPMLCVRPTLPSRIKSSRDLLTLAPGTSVSVAGLVICRQRPATASGVVFFTMEDEFGFVNLLLWSSVFEKFRRVATTSHLLLARGKIERGDVPRGEFATAFARSVPSADGEKPVPSSIVYVLVDKLESLDARLPELAASSRDFH